VPITLKEGLNNLLFKVDEGLGDFALVARLLNYDSILAAIRRHLDDYKTLSLVSEEDYLVAQFGQPFKIGVLAPGEEALIEIFDERSKKVAEKKSLPGFPVQFNLNDLPKGFLLARAENCKSNAAMNGRREHSIAEAPEQV